MLELCTAYNALEDPAVRITSPGHVIKHLRQLDKDACVQAARQTSAANASQGYFPLHSLTHASSLKGSLGSPSLLSPFRAIRDVIHLRVYCAAIGLVQSKSVWIHTR